MTTSSEDFFGPECWVLKYARSDSDAKYTEYGFRTLNVVLRRLKQLQISVYPATIESIDLEQIFDPEIMPEQVVREIEYLDQKFEERMGDPNS